VVVVVISTRYEPGSTLKVLLLRHANHIK